MKSAYGTYRAAGVLWPGRATNAIAVIPLIGGQTSWTWGQRGRGGRLGHALRAVAVLLQKTKRDKMNTHMNTHRHGKYNFFQTDVKSG